MVYEIQEISKCEKFKKKFQGFYPALMVINFAIILNLYFVDIIITEEIRMT